MLQISNTHTVFASQVVNQLQNGHFHFPQQSVLLTFDDGWIGNYDYAFPLLEEYGMRAVAFVQTADIGRPSRCSWDELRQMVHSGIWEVHSHSATHPDLTTLSWHQLQRELSISFQEFRKNGFHHDLLIAYPFGAHSQLVRIAAARAGFQAGFSACPVIKITEQDDQFALPRSTICQLFDQHLVCVKLGLDINLVRHNLSIFDESEGDWTGRWKQFHVREIQSPGLTVGQFGYRFAVSDSLYAAWKKDIEIESPGYYSISTWAPVLDIVSHSQFVWTLRAKDTPYTQSGLVQHCKQNGWTHLRTFRFERGEYELKIANNGNVSTPFIVDAVKVEKIMN